MITLGGDAELELVDSLDPFSEGIVFRSGAPSRPRPPTPHPFWLRTAQAHGRNRQAASGGAETGVVGRRARGRGNGKRVGAAVLRSWVGSRMGGGGGRRGRRIPSIPPSPPPGWARHVLPDGFATCVRACAVGCAACARPRSRGRTSPTSRAGRRRSHPCPSSSRSTTTKCDPPPRPAKTHITPQPPPSSPPFLPAGMVGCVLDNKGASA